MTEIQDRIIRCIERELNSLLGDNISEVVFWHLEQNCDLKSEEIPRKPSEFIRNLQTMLGASALTVEEAIVRDMEREFRRPFKNHSFEEAIRELRMGMIMMQ